MDILRELKKKIADIDAQTLAMEGRSPTFTVSEIMDLIDSVESAQEINCSEIPNSSDTISRQAAIDVIGILLEQSEDDEHDKTWNNAIRSSINAVKHHLPSAQPEIIYCRGCKNWDKTWTNDWSPDYHYCPMIDGVRKGDFYCADAERRGEQNG